MLLMVQSDSVALSWQKPSERQLAPLGQGVLALQLMAHSRTDGLKQPAWVAKATDATTVNSALSATDAPTCRSNLTDRQSQTFAFTRKWIGP